MASAVITGTLQGQSDEVATDGTQTVIITLTDAEWETEGNFNIGATGVRDDVWNSLLSDKSEAKGWNAAVRAAVIEPNNADIVRNSATVVTVTIPDETFFGSGQKLDYDITNDENLTVTIPDGALSAIQPDIVATPTIRLRAARHRQNAGTHTQVKDLI